MPETHNHLVGNGKEATGLRQLRDRYRQEGDEARLTPQTVKTQLDETEKALKTRDQELASSKTEVKRTYKLLTDMQGDFSAAIRTTKETSAANDRCLKLAEAAEEERDAVKKELAALQDAHEALQIEVKIAKFKEEALLEKIEWVEADHAQVMVERNGILLDRVRLQAELKDAKGNMKGLAEDVDALRASRDAEPTEVEDLLGELKRSEESRGRLVRQLEQLAGAMDELKKENDAFVKCGKKADDSAAAHGEAADSMLEELDHQRQVGAVQIRQLKENVAHMTEQDKEVAWMGARIERLLLDNAELKKEVKLYKEEGGVMALD